MDSKAGPYRGTAGLHKRKAEEEMSSDKEKNRRKIGPTSSRMPGMKPKFAPKPSSGLKKNTSSSLMTTTKSTSERPSATSTTDYSKSRTTTNTTTPSSPADPAPKKMSSYKAMLQKAAATHEAQKAKMGVSGVRHISTKAQKKREEEARAAKARAKKSEAQGKSVVPGSGNKSHSATKKPEEPAKPVWRGTAGLGRRHPTTTAKKPSRNIKPIRPTPRPVPPSRRPVSEDEKKDEKKEDYDDDEEDDEDYYYDDESDDMEAGMDEIDEEEEAALLAAKLEDKREQELEERLKKEKQRRLSEARRATLRWAG